MSLFVRSPQSTCLLKSFALWFLFLPALSGHVLAGLSVEQIEAVNDIREKIEKSWFRPPGTKGLKSTVHVRLGTSGNVLLVRTVKSSGNDAFDRSVEAAVMKADPLPIPRGAEGKRFQVINFVFEPDNKTAVSETEEKNKADVTSKSSPSLPQGQIKAQHQICAESAASGSRHEESTNQCSKVASQHHEGAEAHLAEVYWEQGEHHKALPLYLRLAKQGDIKAQLRLGIMRKDGIGVSQDIEQAETWFRGAAVRGNAEAQYRLAMIYIDKHEPSGDEKTIAFWIREAADQGHAKAQYVLGRLHQAGFGVRKSDAEALSWFKKAADQGHSDAITSLRKSQAVMNHNWYKYNKLAYEFASAIKNVELQVGNCEAISKEEVKEDYKNRDLLNVKGEEYPEEVTNGKLMMFVGLFDVHYFRNESRCLEFAKNHSAVLNYETRKRIKAEIDKQRAFERKFN